MFLIIPTPPLLAFHSAPQNPSSFFFSELCFLLLFYFILFLFCVCFLFSFFVGGRGGANPGLLFLGFAHMGRSQLACRTFSSRPVFGLFFFRHVLGVRVMVRV